MIFDEFLCSNIGKWLYKQNKEYMNKIRGEKNMPIIIDEKKKIFHLQTPTTSYVFSIAKESYIPMKER